MRMKLYVGHAPAKSLLRADALSQATPAEKSIVEMHGQKLLGLGPQFTARGSENKDRAWMLRVGGDTCVVQSLRLQFRCGSTS